MTSIQLVAAGQTSDPTPPIPNPFEVSVPNGLVNFYTAVRRTLALTAPSYTVRFRAMSGVCRLLSALLVLAVFAPDVFHADSLRIPWNTMAVSIPVSIVALLLLLMAVAELTIFRPTVFRELTVHKTTVFFDRLDVGYPAVRAILKEIRSTPTDTIANAANKVEMVTLVTNMALRPDVLRVVTMLRVISRIVITILLITVFAMSLNLATGGDVVGNSFNVAGPASINSLDYFNFSSTFFLTLSSSFVIQASGWANVYVILNILAILAIGSFVIASVTTLFLSHDEMVSKAALRLIAIECKL